MDYRFGKWIILSSSAALVHGVSAYVTVCVKIFLEWCEPIFWWVTCLTVVCEPGKAWAGGALVHQLTRIKGKAVSEWHFSLVSVKFILIWRKQWIRPLSGSFQLKWIWEWVQEASPKQREVEICSLWICFEPNNSDLCLTGQDQVLFSFLGWSKPAPQHHALTMLVFGAAHSQSAPLRSLQVRDSRKDMQMFASAWPWCWETPASVSSFLAG